MANIPRLTAGSSAEQVEYCEGLITKILSRVSTRDVLKMCTVVQRWRTIIFDPSFADTHYKNSQPESIFYYHEYNSVRGMVRETFQFRSYNPKTGNLSIVPFSWEGLDSSFLNTDLMLVSASNGLMCFFCPHELADFQVFWVYNPVTKFLRKLSVSFEVPDFIRSFVGICYTHNTGKLMVAGFSDDEKLACTLVFDFQTNSWHKGYDVNQDQWCFSIFIPASVGYPHCLIEWEGNLFVCASDSTYEENQFVLAAGSTHEHYRTIDYRWDGGGGDGHFVFWKLDTEHKLWTRERELNLSHEIHTSWKVSGSSGVVWFTCGYNSLTVYHMGNRHWSTHRLDDALALRQRKNIIECVSFEPTLLSF
ncbi:uncharacterized protein LOC131044938 isoform X2 [Cryptomeria japonica]|uniref:uncharacterized protein LOC131044938 isoform X2 n=1 Tax=Cryptomeria japonica TaxID=3369 RepID=UPI0027DA6040|nr:uncharacterized protein LOC131044938 isoform X2 [Cryptomeria japonica]